MGLLDDAGKNIAEGFTTAKEKAEHAGAFVKDRAEDIGEFVKDRAEDVGEFVEVAIERIKGDDDDEKPGKGGSGV